jgi:hypothetical protein
VGVDEEANQDLPAELVPIEAIDEWRRDFGPEHEVVLISDDRYEEQWGCQCGLDFDSKEAAEEHRRAAESSS